MKIHQLPMGARFEYAGEEYVKCGPLTATSNGRQRLIPKYAVLKPIGVVEVIQDNVMEDGLARGRVLQAFAAFYAACERLVPADKAPALSAARAQFLKALD